MHFGLNLISLHKQRLSQKFTRICIIIIPSAPFLLLEMLFLHTMNFYINFHFMTFIKFSCAIFHIWWVKVEIKFWLYDISHYQVYEESCIVLRIPIWCNISKMCKIWRLHQSHNQIEMCIIQHNLSCFKRSLKH